MASAPPGKGSRAWLATAWICGLLLATSIAIALSATLLRFEHTMDLIDQPGARPEDFAELLDESTRRTKLSLYFGVPVALLYLTALFSYRRSKRRPT